MRRALDDELWIRQTLDAANFGYSEAPAGTREGARWGFTLSNHARVVEPMLPPRAGAVRVARG